jgi:hypothetical protein
MTHSLTLGVLARRLAICRMSALAAIPAWATAEAFFSVTRTADELSVVCGERHVPAEATASRGWRALMLHGPFDFAQSGIMAAVAAPLSAAGIPIFPIATYDTDYVLVRADELQRAIEVLREAGHTVLDAPASG